ncbi:MAG: nicotinamide-nucleotide amidase, partial [Pseudomonadota bacterium]|nr:nicotinamide-nucleotide amidase [Pseudomonadota bacterium]
MHLELRILKLLPSLAKCMLAKNWKLALAESCSGGKLAATLTALAGSSKWFDFSLVTYSNEAKMNFLQVSSELLEKEGAVSEACALAMVRGLSTCDDFRLAITGFAGPDGD